MTILQDDILHLAREQANGAEVVEGNFDELFEHYLSTGRMPYGVAKARTGDPYQWIADELERELQLATIAGEI